MQNRHNRIIIWILAVLSPLLCAVTYPFLPEQIPVHWDVNGTVSYSGKETFLLMAALPLLLAALLIRESRVIKNSGNIMTIFACS